MKRNVGRGNGKNSKDKSLVGMVWRCRKDLRVYPGQGTTEYAILVGVLVVLLFLRLRFSDLSCKNCGMQSLQASIVCRSLQGGS